MATGRVKRNITWIGGGTGGRGLIMEHARDPLSEYTVSHASRVYE